MPLPSIAFVLLTGGLQASLNHPSNGGKPGRKPKEGGYKNHGNVGFKVGHRLDSSGLNRDCVCSTVIISELHFFPIRNNTFQTCTTEPVVHQQRVFSSHISACQELASALKARHILAWFFFVSY